MNKARWNSLVDLVGRALELEGAEREALLQEACRDDPQLRTEADHLLRSGTLPADFLVPPAMGELPVAGSRLGEFTLLSELGRGGMGVVYLARQDGLPREVAVKVLAVGLTTTALQIERFHREAQAVARLRHPGIVQVLAEGQEGDLHWFAMEYVTGHDLQRELELQRATAAPGADRSFLMHPDEREHMGRLAKLVADVADALHAAHREGLIHRDVKPSNLLLGPDRRVQIGDFGLVRDESMGKLTKSNEVAGTPHYMSPEQARTGLLRVDHRTDIYSLGVVLYELLTLEKPFEGRTSAEVFTSILDVDAKSPRALNPSCPRDLETICLKAMSRQPERRYRTAGEFGEDLRRFLRQEPIVARPPTTRERLVRWGFRRRVPIAAAALLVLGLGSGGLWAKQAARARVSAFLSLDLATEAGRPWIGPVFATPIDLITGQPQDAASQRRLGTLPLDRVRLDPGYYRLRVELDDRPPSEFPVWLSAGDRALAWSVRDAPLGREGMAWIEGGLLAQSDGLPDHPLDGRTVEVESFLLDEAEVTNAEFALFLEAHPQREPPATWGPQMLQGERVQLPVGGVSWEDARAYAAWVGKRLPSQAEWLFAARGTENRLYPSGSDAVGEGRGNGGAELLLRTQGVSFEEYVSEVVAVRSFEAARTPEGVHHLFGNVEEWTESIPWHRTKEVAHTYDRVYLGGDWTVDTSGRNLPLTYSYRPTGGKHTKLTVGFRCAMSATAP